MTRRSFSREFKQEAVELITKCGVSTAEASRDLGIHATVLRRWVRQAAFRARPRRRRPPKDQGTRSVIAANVLEREFDANGPNQKWVAAFTYVWTTEGWLYVAAVIDLFSRRVVGWSLSADLAWPNRLWGIA